MVPGRPARSRSDRSERADAEEDVEQLAQREPFWAEVDSEVLGETTWDTVGRLTFGPSTESSTDRLETLGRLEILNAEPVDGRSAPERAPLGRSACHCRVELLGMVAGTSPRGGRPQQGGYRRGAVAGTRLVIVFLDASCLHFGSAAVMVTGDANILVMLPFEGRTQHYRTVSLAQLPCS